MHLLIAKNTQIMEQPQNEVVRIHKSTSEPRWLGFFKCNIKVILSVSTYLVCHHLFQSTCIIRRFARTSFFETSKVDFLLKEKKNAKTNKTKPSNGVIQILASHKNRHIIYKST